MKLPDAISVTAEMLGYPLSELAIAGMARALREHPPADVATALKRCSRECRGRLTLPAILERLPGQAPGPDEAWSIASGAYDEVDTIVWTGEMAEAFGQVRQMTDKVAARMAFREIYSRLVAESNEMPSWFVSPGHDRTRRLRAVQDAVEAKRLSAEHLREFEHLPTHRALPRSRDDVPMLPSEAGEVGRALIAKLRAGSEAAE